MNGNEFIKKIKRAAKKNNIKVRFVKAHGKGSHGTLCYGDEFTIVKDRKKRDRAWLAGFNVSRFGLN